MIEFIHFPVVEGGGVYLAVNEISAIRDYEDGTSLIKTKGCDAFRVPFNLEDLEDLLTINVLHVFDGRLITSELYWSLFEEGIETMDDLLAHMEDPKWVLSRPVQNLKFSLRDEVGIELPGTSYKRL